MNYMIKGLLVLSLSLLFTGCEVGITPLEKSFNEAGVATSAEVTEDGDIGTITIDIQEGVEMDELDVKVEIFGSGSEHFTVKMDKTTSAYIGEITVKPDFIVYKDTSFSFSARTIVNGQKMCAKEVQKTVYKKEVAPEVQDQNISVTVNTPEIFTLEATDKNGDTFTFEFRDKPQKGIVLGSGPTFTYTPELNATGKDSFTYVVKDEHNTSALARVSIMISSDGIIANKDTNSTYEDRNITISVLENDSKGIGTISSVGNATHGTTSIVNNAMEILYTPNKDYHGDDSFTYTTSTDKTATVDITVISVNDVPIGIAQKVNANEDENKTIDLNATDVDNSNASSLTYHLESNAGNGDVSINGNKATYVPNPDYFGTDSFTFVVRDEHNATSDAVSIDINISDTPDNIPPIAEDINVTMDGNVNSIPFDLNGSDSDILDILTYTIVDKMPDVQGILSLNGKRITYTRSTTYTGNTSFTYQVNDGTSDSDIATVYIKSNVPNKLPIAKPNSPNTTKNVLVKITLVASDADSDPLTYRIGISPSYGTLSVTDNNVSYTPNTDYTGTDTFTFIANDGKDDSNEALVTVKISDQSHEDKVLFSLDKELWSTDGTIGGTSIVKDINENGDSSPQSFIKINDTYFFTADDGIKGRELWKSQGTKESTALVKNIRKKGNGNADPRDLTNINDTLFFTAKNGKNGRELWKSDGTNIGTTMVKNINEHGQSKPEILTNVNGVLYFTANDGKYGIELWRSDGTRDGTKLVNDIKRGGSSSPKELTPINGLLWFTADTNSGRQLCSNDSSTQDIEMHTNYDKFAPQNLYNYNGTLVFSAFTDVFGRELWKANMEGTDMVENFAGVSSFSSLDSSPYGFETIVDRLYFGASDFSTGTNLRYLDDINGAKIQNVKNIFTGAPKSLMTINNQVFFYTEIGNDLSIWNTVGGDTPQENKSIKNAIFIKSWKIGNSFIFITKNRANKKETLWVTTGNDEASKLSD